MSIIHIKNALATSGLTGMQSAQRDWSPYLVHFTNWSAMAPLRKMATLATAPGAVRTSLDEADATSFGIVQLILSSGKVLARSPGDKTAIPPCVCLSECDVPGLVSHSERYGRFGFVFTKAALFSKGARPCLYLDSAMYRGLRLMGTAPGASKVKREMFGLANVYRPPQKGRKVLVQDYTHEREWRVFAEINFAEAPPCQILAPAAYTGRVRDLAVAHGLDVNVIPIDTLFEWGA